MKETGPWSTDGGVGVVVPVHNEEDLLEASLQAVAAAADAVVDRVTCHTVVVLDNCTDDSATIAYRWRRRMDRGHQRHRIDVIETDARSVGAARRAGCAAIIARWLPRPLSALWLATTDADSEVPADWLAVQVAHHRAGREVWTGRVAVHDWSDRDPTTAQIWQRQYVAEELPVHGANLGIVAARYVEVGGFPPVATGEDRALVHAAVAAGADAVHDHLYVVTSSRPEGRAPGGFAHALSVIGQESTDGEDRLALAEPG